jgi:transcriptional regulator with XRE-family HTH domain
MGNGANQPEKKRISERLRVLMRQRNLREKDLQAITGVSHSAVSGWVNGTRRPSHKNLYKIAAAYNVTTDWLLGLTEVQQPMETDNDKIIRCICDYTGLDEKSTETLHQADDKQKARMNKLIQNPPFADRVGRFVEDFEIKPKF